MGLTDIFMCLDATSSHLSNTWVVIKLDLDQILPLTNAHLEFLIKLQKHTV